MRMESTKAKKAGSLAVVGGQERRAEELGSSARSDGDLSGGARSLEAPTTASPVEVTSAGSRAPVPDPEVPARPTRRRFKAAYKQRILKDALACKVPGEIGSLLRREGLYSSLLSTWRRQQEEGALHALAGEKRGPKADPDRQHPLAQKLVQSEKKVSQLERQLKKAHLMLDLQKKVSEILGISLEPMPSDENE